MTRVYKLLLLSMRWIIAFKSGKDCRYDPHNPTLEKYIEHARRGSRRYLCKLRSCGWDGATTLPAFFTFHHGSMLRLPINPPNEGPPRAGGGP